MPQHGVPKPASLVLRGQTAFSPTQNKRKKKQFGYARLQLTLQKEPPVVCSPPIQSMLQVQYIAKYTILHLQYATMTSQFS